jgi:3-hydroxyphenylacetate 6-hydroxylase
LLDEIVHVEHEMVNMRNTLHNLHDSVPLVRLNPFSTQLRKARHLRDRRDAYFNSLNAELDGRRAAGPVDVPCIRSAFLDRANVDEDQVQLTCLTFVSAGMAPTSATLQWSIAMLAQRPDVQQAAYDALRERYEKDEKLRALGTAHDDQSCEYIVALARECLR